MRIFLLSLTLPFFLGASPVSATDWAKDFNIWVNPNASTGITVSGLGNWITVSVDKNGNATITNQISTRPIKQTKAQKNRKRRINIGISN